MQGLIFRSFFLIKFVKTLIKNCCSNNTEFTNEFPEYFRGGNDPFAPLIEALKKLGENYD